MLPFLSSRRGDEHVAPGTHRPLKLRKIASRRRFDNATIPAQLLVPSSAAVVARSRYFPPFSRALRVLTSRRACRIAVSSRPMKVEGEAQVKAAPGEDDAYLAMGLDRRGDRGRLRADFHGPPRPARPEGGRRRRGAP